MPTTAVTKKTKTAKTKSEKTSIKSTTSASKNTPSASKNTKSTKNKKTGGAATNFNNTPLEQLKKNLTTMHNNEYFFKTIRKKIDIEDLKKALTEAGYIDPEGNLTTDVKPLNVFARQAAGVMKNEVDQSLLGQYGEEFMVCHNLPENDVNAAELKHKATASMAIPDENGPGHVFITTKDLAWKKFNVISMDTGDIDFLKEMRKVGKHYARNRGWEDTKVGMYFHCFPYNTVQSLHLHVVNLANVGHAFEYQAHKNLPIDSVIAVLESEKKPAKMQQIPNTNTNKNTFMQPEKWKIGGKRVKTKKNDKKTQKK